MKKILSIGLFLLVTTISFGQDIRVGLQISPNTTWAKVTKDYENKSAKLQFSWGVRAEKNFTDRNFSLFGGIDLTSKGAKVEIKHETNGNYKMNYSGQYLEIPIGIKMQTRPIGELSYWFNIGLVPNFNLSEDVTITLDGEDIKVSDDQLTVLNMSLLVGAGVQYELTEGTDLVGGIQFNNGFTNNTQNIPDYDSRISFNSIGLFIGVLF